MTVRNSLGVDTEAWEEDRRRQLGTGPGVRILIVRRSEGKFNYRAIKEMSLHHKWSRSIPSSPSPPNDPRLFSPQSLPPGSS